MPKLPPATSFIRKPLWCNIILMPEETKSKEEILKGIYETVYNEGYFKIFDEYYPKIERVKEITDLNTLQAVIRNVTTVFQEDPWYRGHPRKNLDLVAPIFRGNNSQDVYFDERDKISHWMRFASFRCDNPPKSDDYPSWLYLMRHHGLKTRLLDWSTSVLTALFFALDNLDSDGELIMLSPSHMNFRTMGTFGVCTHDSPVIRELCKAPITGSKPVLYDDIDKKPLKELIPAACFYPKEIDLRMFIQQSVFSVHSNNTPIDKFQNPEFFVHRFIIPKEAKPEYLRFVCLSCGIKQDKLFPDLDNLSEVINHQIFPKVRSRYIPE